MSAIFTKYMGLLQSKPLLTKCATSALLLRLGDPVCQKWENSKYLFRNTSNFNAVNIGSWSAM